MKRMRRTLTLCRRFLVERGFECKYACKNKGLFCILCTGAFFLCLQSVLCSCSLDYGQRAVSSANVPEFAFYGAEFTRIENNMPKLYMKAAKLEQYGGTDAMYVQDAVFTLYDGENVRMEGSCALLSAERNEKRYHFFSHIDIKDYEKNAEVQAENLRWDGTGETLDGGKDDAVSISVSNDNGTVIQVQGTGFSARGIDVTYAFEGKVSGTIETAEAAGNAEQVQSAE